MGTERREDRGKSTHIVLERSPVTRPSTCCSGLASSQLRGGHFSEKSSVCVFLPEELKLVNENILGALSDLFLKASPLPMTPVLRSIAQSTQQPG